MRFLLDAHVSGPRVGQRLSAAGHEVRALDQERALEGLDDDEVLALAAAEERILVTHNIRDFRRARIEWPGVWVKTPQQVLTEVSNGA